MALNIQKIYEICQNCSKTKNCKYIIELDRLNEKLLLLTDTNKYLTAILLELQQDKPNKINLPRTIYEENVPCQDL